MGIFLVERSSPSLILWLYSSPAESINSFHLSGCGNWLAAVNIFCISIRPFSKLSYNPEKISGFYLPHNFSCDYKHEISFWRREMYLCLYLTDSLLLRPFLYHLPHWFYWSSALLLLHLLHHPLFPSLKWHCIYFSSMYFCIKSATQLWVIVHWLRNV